MSLDFETLRETRAANPEAIAQAYKSRKRRDIIQGTAGYSSLPPTTPLAEH